MFGHGNGGIKVMRENIDLVEIKTVSVDINLPKIERIADYIRQIKDPYHFRCGKYAITAIYSENGPTLEDCLQRIMA